MVVGFYFSFYPISDAFTSADAAFCRRSSTASRSSACSSVHKRNGIPFSIPIADHFSVACFDRQLNGFVEHTADIVGKMGIGT